MENIVNIGLIYGVLRYRLGDDYKCQIYQALVFVWDYSLTLGQVIILMIYEGIY